VNPCNSPWKCLSALQSRASRETRIVGKVYNLYRMKTDISAVLTVTSSLDPHMIIELEDELNCGPCLWLWLCLCLCYISSISFSVGFSMNLYLSNQVLIKFDQLKLRYKPVSLSLILDFMSYNSQHLLSTNHKCTHACYYCCLEERVM
jgi:hypothetical protein